MRVRKHNPTVLFTVLILLFVLCYLSFCLLQTSLQQKQIVETFYTSTKSDTVAYLSPVPEITDSDIENRLKNRVFILSSPSGHQENPFYHIAPAGPFELRPQKKP